MRRFVRLIGDGMIAVGAFVLLGTGSLYGYSQIEEAQAARAVQMMTPVVQGAWTVTPNPDPEATPVVQATATMRSYSQALGDVSSSSASPQFVPWKDRVGAGQPVSPTPVPVPTPIPIYPVERIVAPSIHLDAKVVESPIVNGEWEVPKFAAGHLQGTDQPLQGGNVVLAGHIESLSSGDVFANVDRLRPGATIRLYTKASVVPYVVERVETVANNDMQVVAPTSSEILTLITCSGTWLPLQRDYNQRTVVIAKRAT